MKKVFKYTVVFIILILIFNLLLFLGSIFPSSWIEKTVKRSSEILLEEGNIYYFIPKLMFGVTNNYTDALMINECYSIDNETPFYSYMSARRNYKKDLTVETRTDTVGEGVSINYIKLFDEWSGKGVYDTIGELDDFINERINISIEYARYWHGYLFFLRIFLLIFDILQIRYILLIIFIILFIILMRLLNKKIGSIISVIFGFSLFCEGYFLVYYSLESSPIFITMMLGCIFLLMNIEKMKDFYLYIFIIACITTYIDYFTVPLITLGMPLYIYILYKQRSTNLTVKESLKIVFISGIVWGLGYFLTWFAKWFLYDIIFDKDLVKSAITQALYRAESTNNATSNTIGTVLYNFIYNNIFYFLFFAIIFHICLIFLNLRNKITYNRKKFYKYIKEILPFIIITFLPIAWYIILTNHTVLHSHFVYRHMLIFLTGIIIVYYKWFEIIRKNDNKQMKKVK